MYIESFHLYNNFSSGKGEDAAGGALAGGCLAAGCLVRLAVAALGILLVLWLFGVLFD